MAIDTKLNLIVAVVTIAILSQSVGAEYDKDLFRKLVRYDNTNDDAISLDAQQLLKRSGYDYEEYYSVADDGYITQLVRIINPLVERKNLRKVPFILYHGANVDMTIYLVSSSIQHHPEPWPRTPEDGPMTSSNRSLAFTLANNGYDVWLIGQRGSNLANMGHTKSPDGKLTVLDLDNRGKNMTLGETFYELARTKHYWQYSLDDIIAHEIRHQIDVVRKNTGSREYFLWSYSLSTPTTIAFLAEHPDYAQDCKGYFQLAPAIASDHFSTFARVYFEHICPKFPTRGVGFTPTYVLKPLIRSLVLSLSRSVHVKYGLIRVILESLFGPSPKYNTNLERNVLGHAFMPVSFKSVQQYCRAAVSKKLTKFDYGPAKNLAIYNQILPPEYDISKIQVQNYVVISGLNDALADPSTVQRLIEEVHAPRKTIEIRIPRFNHLDMVAATEVDKYVNLPTVELLNKFISEETFT